MNFQSSLAREDAISNDFASQYIHFTFPHVANFLVNCNATCIPGASQQEGSSLFHVPSSPHVLVSDISS